MRLLCLRRFLRLLMSMEIRSCRLRQTTTTTIRCWEDVVGDGQALVSELHWTRPQQQLWLRRCLRVDAEQDVPEMVSWKQRGDGRPSDRQRRRGHRQKTSRDSMGITRRRRGAVIANLCYATTLAGSIHGWSLQVCRTWQTWLSTSAMVYDYASLW